MFDELKCFSDTQIIGKCSVPHPDPEKDSAWDFEDASKMHERLYAHVLLLIGTAIKESFEKKPREKVDTARRAILS